MKKVFRTHIILITLGRLFLTFVTVFGCYMLYMFVKFSIIERTIEFYIFSIILSVILGFFSIVSLPFLWPRCFGKLIVYKDKIVWRCLFLKTRKLRVTDIKQSAIKSFEEGNVIKYDFYNTGFLYMIVSTKGIPNQIVSKYKCNKELIIFPLNQKLCSCLADVLLPPQNAKFKSKLIAYKKLNKNKSKHSK